MSITQAFALKSWKFQLNIQVKSCNLRKEEASSSDMKDRQRKGEKERRGLEIEITSTNGSELKTKRIK